MTGCNCYITGGYRGRYDAGIPQLPAAQGRQLMKINHVLTRTYMRTYMRAYTRT